VVCGLQLVVYSFEMNAYRLMRNGAHESLPKITMMMFRMTTMLRINFGIAIIIIQIAVTDKMHTRIIYALVKIELTCKKGAKTCLLRNTSSL
jgi:hypothetical protein